MRFDSGADWTTPQGPEQIQSCYQLTAFSQPLEAIEDSAAGIAPSFKVSVRSSGEDPCCPTAVDALDAAVNGCPERAPRGLRNRAGVP